MDAEKFIAQGQADTAAGSVSKIDLPLASNVQLPEVILQTPSRQSPARRRGNDARERDIFLAGRRSERCSTTGHFYLAGVVLSVQWGRRQQEPRELFGVG